MNQIEASKKELFENTPVTKAILQLSVPTIISQLISLIYNLADTFFVGKTGNPYMIAGVSLAFTLYVLTIPLSALYGIGGGSAIARMMGQGELDKAKTVSSYSCWMSVHVSVVFSLLVYIFMTPLLRLLGSSDATTLYSKQYTMMVVVLGSAPIVLSMVIAHLLRNTGYSTQASIGLSGGGILNIILDPIFMFVIFPDGYEVLAAASATLLSNLLALTYLILVFIKVSKKSPLSISPKDFRRIEKDSITSVYSVGVPSAILSGLYDLGNIVLNSRMSLHGDLEVAAIGITQKVERLPNAIGIGLSQGMLPLVAYNFTSGNHTRMKSVINKGRNMGLLMAICCLVLYAIAAPYMVGVFLTGTDELALTTLALATTFLRIRTLSSPFQFINYHTSFSLQAMGNGKGTLVHAVIRIIIIYIPMMFLLDYLFNANGLAIAFPVSEALSDVAAIIMMNSWLKKVAKQ